MAIDDKLPELKMDPANLYREEVFTDRRMGTIRRLTPVKADGSADDKRKVIYVGYAQLLTPVGALPISFEIEAASLGEAIEKFGPAAQAAVERTVKELRELQREAASSIIIPESGAAGGFGPSGLPPGGGGRIKLP
jgi:hypothetical protein